MGTRGAPAHYGGFETAVEEIGAGLVDLGHDVTVYCRRDGRISAGTYRGMHRVVLPALRRKALETLSHTGVSALHALRHRPDVAIVYNAANAPWVGLLRAAGIPTAMHLDGHDGRRAKWRGLGARYYSVATRFGVRAASKVIVDSQTIQDELQHSHRVRSRFIPYGAAASLADADDADRLLGTLGLERARYHLLVARFEPENQVLEIIRGYRSVDATLPLVVVGFAGYPGEYAGLIGAEAAENPGVRLLGAIWDQPLLDTLYDNARSYLHGHSVGGTNPSLLRAMTRDAPILAYDCSYNQETMGGAALWWRSAADIGPLLLEVEADADGFVEMVERACKRAAGHYTWPDVVSAYDALVNELARR